MLRRPIAVRTAVSAGLSAALCAALLPGAAGQANARTVHYDGNVGQQHVAMALTVQGDVVRGGRYHYDRQADVAVVDSRVIGTTVVLQDEDGNTLHLHFAEANGDAAAGFNAPVLQGVLDRGAMDLPVRLHQVPAPTP